MIDKWFLADLEQQMKRRKRVVILDPAAQCGFLLPFIAKKGYIVLRTDGSLSESWQMVREELFMRCAAETEHKEAAVAFYVTRPLDKLSFLYDYCFTHGLLDLSNPAEWLRQKLFAHTGLQVQMDPVMLLAAGKKSAGKDLTWWKKILQNLEDVINLEEELLPFLHAPEAYLNGMDKDIRHIFEEKIFDLLGQPPMAKPPKTLANEVVKKLFDGLAANNASRDLLNLYYKWADSDSYSPSLVAYISAHKLKDSLDPWAAHPDHCFAALDRKAFHQLTAQLANKSLRDEKLPLIKARAASEKAKRFVPPWWQDVIALLECGCHALTACHSLEAVVGFYTRTFAAADRAIRHLYAHFLQETSLIRHWQDFYESMNQELLQKWFEYAATYQPDQQGTLVNLFKSAKPGTAVIVGDGVRYEIADHVATELESQLKVDRKVMLAGMPSETEHNMSALYLDSDKVLSVHKDREQALTAATGKNIVYRKLDALSYADKVDYLVLTYKDIDSTGEDLQMGALKLFDEFERVLAEKIRQLLNMGYREVHLVTDHGFVLTGLLEEADKIPADATGKKDVGERFIRTVKKQTNPHWVGFAESYGEYNYVYAAKNHRPFKSKGSYGYSHGGFTPQEIILPKFTFRKEKPATEGLAMAVINKQELADVVGDHFAIKLQAAAPKVSDLFSQQRKLYVALYAGGVSCGQSNIVNMEPGGAISLEFSLQGKTELQAIVLDADSQEQLDRVNVKKSASRDLGGLL